MTPEERGILKALGEDIIVNFSPMAAVVFLSGISATLFCTTTYLAVKQGLRSYARRILLGVTVASFMIICSYCSMLSVVTFLEIRTMIDNVGMPLAQRKVAFEGRRPVLALVLNWIWSLLPFLTDLMTIWRGAALFPEQRWGFISACFLSVAGVATMFTEQGFLIEHPSLAYTGSLIARLDAVGITLSFAANVVATSSTAYGVWSYRHYLVTQLNVEARQHFRVYKVLRLLVESGLAYSLIQIAAVFIAFFTKKTLSNPSIFRTVFMNVYAMISAMYPTVVALMIKHKGTFVETYADDTDTD